MNEEARRPGRWGCWKSGCAGCGAVALAGVVVLIIALVRGSVAPDPRHDELSFDLAALAGAPLEIVLDLQKGEFSVEPAPAGEPLRLEASYDAAVFELEASLDPGQKRFDLVFDSRPLIATVEKEDSEDASVRLLIPRGQPVRLRGKVRIGGSRLELGGLALEDLDLGLSMGEHVIAFTEPTSTTGALIALEGSMGQLEVEGLGNASPSAARLRHSAGEMTLDLAGAWRQDAEIDLGCRAGQCRVTAPGPEVGFLLEDTSVLAGSVRNQRAKREAPSGAPLVRVRASTAAGSVEIH